MKTTPLVFTALLATLSFETLHAQSAKPTDRSATATMKAAAGQKMKGEVRLQESGSNLEVTIDVQGLQPGAVHAIHIHENGKCEEPKFESAGGHFNPTKEPHAHPVAKQHHLGDLGNVVADKNGNAKVDLSLTRLKLSGETSPIGKAVILHAKPDDLRSQPSGEAGDRIACGIISAK